MLGSGPSRAWRRGTIAILHRDADRIRGTGASDPTARRDAARKLLPGAPKCLRGRILGLAAHLPDSAGLPRPRLVRNADLPGIAKANGLEKWEWESRFSHSVTRGG